MRLITRRRVLVGAALAAGGAAYATQVEPVWLSVPRRRLAVPGLSSAWSGRTLAHLSDLHAGTLVPDGYLRDSFERIADLRPDVVLYTGDFVSWEGGVERLERLLRHAPRGTLATLGVLGNHDYGHHWRDEGAAREVAAAVNAAGITLLRNQCQRVDGLAFCGVDDLWARQARMEQAFEDLRPGETSLILNHNPDAVDLPGWSGRRGWVFAGHTHGGQCKPPFLPPPLLPVRNPRYTRGVVGLRPDLYMSISSGVGFVRRIRFNVRPEAPVFTLEPA